MRSVCNHVPHLALSELELNRRLARRLPPALARRYHALPLAQDNGHITVAMANPNDLLARAAITTALGKPLYVVHSDRVDIDHRLAELWPDRVNQPLSLLVYDAAGPGAGEVTAYGRYLADLLGSPPTFFPPQRDESAGVDDWVEAAEGYDLVIFGEPDQSLLERLLAGPTACQAVKQIDTSVLIARQPRRPLQKILLVTRGQDLDQAAVDWGVRLAEPSQATVAVLAVLPPTPAMYSQLLSGYDLAYWLTTETPLGRQVRQIARRLVNWEITGTLHFRQGAPCHQIKREVAETQPDLIVIAADSPNWLLRRIPGQLVRPLLRWADRPVLIAKYR